jgi:hypothetical protein
MVLQVEACQNHITSHHAYPSQVRDLAFFIEAQRTISTAAEGGGEAGELRDATVLPLPQQLQVRGGACVGCAGAWGEGFRV